MNQDEDEDTYLYGDPSHAPVAAAGEPIASSLPKTTDQEMEPASEEGEVDDEDDEDESDSVLHFTKRF
jgi:hypothetical protein